MYVILMKKRKQRIIANEGTENDTDISNPHRDEEEESILLKNESDYHAQTQSTHRFRHGILSYSAEQETYIFAQVFRHVLSGFLGQLHVSGAAFDGKLKEQIDLQWEKEPIFLPVSATLRPPGM